jgi:hypothetical protein
VGPGARFCQSRGLPGKKDAAFFETMLSGGAAGVVETQRIRVKRRFSTSDGAERNEGNVRSTCSGYRAELRWRKSGIELLSPA